MHVQLYPNLAWQEECQTRFLTFTLLLCAENVHGTAPHGQCAGVCVCVCVCVCIAESSRAVACQTRTCVQISSKRWYVHVIAGCWDGAAAHAESTCRRIQGYQGDARSYSFLSPHGIPCYSSGSCRCPLVAPDVPGIYCGLTGHTLCNTYSTICSIFCDCRHAVQTRCSYSSCPHGVQQCSTKTRYHDRWSMHLHAWTTRQLASSTSPS